MKRILLSMLTLGVLTLSSHGQGTVLFANNSATLFQYYPYPITDTPSPVPVGGGHVELLWAPVGTTDLNAFQVLGAAVAVGANAGRFSGGTRTVPAGSGSTGIAPGGMVALYVRGWTGSATSWFQVNFSSDQVAYSSIFTLDTGDPTTTPAQPPTALTAPGGFQGMVTITPEPSSAALLLLSCGLLGWRKRRL